MDRTNSNVRWFEASWSSNNDVLHSPAFLGSSQASLCGWKSQTLSFPDIVYDIILDLGLASRVVQHFLHPNLFILPHFYEMALLNVKTADCAALSPSRDSLSVLESVTEMLRGQQGDSVPRIWWNGVALRSVRRRFLAYQSLCAGPVLFGEVWEECRRSWEFSYIVASLCCNPQRNPLVPPMGFHFKSPAFVQKCVCSPILFGNYVKQKRMNGEENHSSSLPTLQPHPITTSLPLFPTLSLPLSLFLAVHILQQMLMISPSVFWCKVCLHFPFHPHTNVLLLPLRPRAFLVAFLKYAVW